MAAQPQQTKAQVTGRNSKQQGEGRPSTPGKDPDAAGDKDPAQGPDAAGDKRPDGDGRSTRRRPIAGESGQDPPLASDDAPAGDGRHMRADARRNYGLLVEAARKVFADQGGQASMEAVAKQAGVGVGTLYRHFPKRIDLVEAVYRDDVDALVEEAETSSMNLPPWEALEGWLRAYVAYARSKRTFLNELHEAFEKNPGLKSESRERITEACDRVLARAQSAGDARGDTSGADVMQLVSPMCMSPTLEAEQGERLLTVILAGLRAAAV